MTTGVHAYGDVLRGLVVGANCVQLCSVLYGKEGFACIARMKSEISDWMLDKGYDSIDAFHGMLREPEEGPSRGFNRAQYVTTLLEQ